MRRRRASLTTWGRDVTHPLCHARDLITETPAGSRIAIGALFAALTPAERCRWFEWAGKAVCDDGGILPDGVERFLESLSNAKAD